ncbi:hypothetical protein FHT86_005832 [Rhizobium sp. BK313]|nr:hypothetical protein [Rhizobium sp. BK313]
MSSSAARDARAGDELEARVALLAAAKEVRMFFL